MNLNFAKSVHAHQHMPNMQVHICKQTDTGKNYRILFLRLLLIILLSTTKIRVFLFIHDIFTETRAQVMRNRGKQI